jgi:hypothetical protein
MAEQYIVTTGAVALVAATAKIPIEIATAAAIDAVMVGLDVTFDAVFAATVPLIEFCTYGTVGSGGTVPTPLKYGQNQSRVASTVARINDTTAPTTIVQLFAWYYASLSYIWPLGREFELLPNSKYCVRVTSPVAANCVINAIWEE